VGTLLVFIVGSDDLLLGGMLGTLTCMTVTRWRHQTPLHVNMTETRMTPRNY
jgi:hypothetical protein